MGDRLVRAIEQKREENLHRCPFCVNPTLGDGVTDLFSVVVLASCFNLEKVHDAGMRYWEAFFQSASRCSIWRDTPSNGSAGNQLLNLIERLDGEGCQAWGRALAIWIIRGIDAIYY